MRGKWILQVAQKKWVAMQILVFSTAHPSIDCKKFREILRGCGLKLELFDWKEIELNDSPQQLLTKWELEKNPKGILVASSCILDKYPLIKV